MKPVVVFIILMNFQLLFCSSIQNDNLKKIYSPVKITEDIKIDGILNEDAWSKALYLSDFVQTNPNYKLNPDVLSKVKIIYNDNSIYFGILLYDDMNSVKLKVGEYDDWENTFEDDSDYFSIELDSFNDNQSAYIFTVNSSGVRADSKFYNGFYDDSWDAAWNSKVKLYDNMWIIEVEIPIINLKFNNRDNISMGINFLRYKYSSNAYISWSKNPENRSADFLIDFGIINNMNFNVKDKLMVKPIFYHFNINSEGFYYKDYEYDNDQIIGLVNPTNFNDHFNNNTIGLDINYSIKTNMSLDLTLNPNFQHIKEDPAEVNTSAYETYFEENRPFFIKDNSIFSTPINIYYSRRIGKEVINYQYIENNSMEFAQFYSKLDFASKLIGKNHNNTDYGFIIAQANTYDDLNIFDDKKAFYSVLRTKINGANGFIGLMNTNYAFENSYSHAYSLDGLLEHNGLEFSYQLVQSKINQKTGIGLSQEIDYYSDVKLTPNFKYETVYWFKYDRFDKDFNISNVGYLSRNDLENFNLGFAIDFFEQRGKIVESNFVLQCIIDKNISGVTLDHIYHMEWYAKLINNWMFNISISSSELSYIDRFYDDYFSNNFYNQENVKHIKKSPQDNIVVNFSTDSRKRISFSTMWNYFVNDINDDGKAKQFSVRFKPTDKLDFGLSFYDLSFYKTYYFLKIRMIPTGNDHIIHNFNNLNNQLTSRNDFEYLFTNSNNTERIYSFNMSGHVRNNFSINFFVEYFIHNDNWIGDKYSINTSNQSSDFIFPQEDNSITLNDDDKLLYLSKYTSLISNINFKWEIDGNMRIIFGYIYSKQINGLDIDKFSDLIDFKASEITNSNKAELFFDETFFIKYEFNI